MTSPARPPGCLLFDLDGTLLDVRMSAFIEAYFPLLAPCFGASKDLTRFKWGLIDSVQAMMKNRDGERFLSQVFLETFSPLVDMPPEEVRRVLREFHARGFEELRPLTRPLPEARPLLEKALNLGYELAVATNPVFFPEAIRARIRWAGVDDIPFGFISTAENMHFSKPHPEYFTEVLRHVGRSPSECVMVGDDPTMDMPAAKVGITTWHVPRPGSGKTDERADHRGSLGELGRWLEERGAAPAP